MPRKLMEYAIYRGDEFQFIGTAKECAECLGVTPQTISYHTTPAGKKRATRDGIHVVKLGVFEEDAQE